MIAGPEQARLLKEFEREFIVKETKENHHHEEGFCTQKTFREQTLSLVHAINEMSNPFLDDTPELAVLDTQNVVNESVVSTVRTVEAIGRDQYNMYHKSVIVERTHSIHDPIKKNSFPLFRSPTPKTKSKQAGQISMLKSDVELFSRLYIAMQHRKGDMNTFFKHENHPYPPSLSDRGKLRQGKKSDLLSVLIQETQTEPPVLFDVKILDGAAVVHFLSTTGITTFNDYASSVFTPHIMKNLDSSKRVDVVWDTYIVNSIKESVRERRGKGTRRKVRGWCMLLSQFTCCPNFCLVDYTLGVLQQGILSWWNAPNDPILLTEQLLPCFINRLQTAGSVIHNNCETFKILEMLRFLGQ